ncbi:MAG: hypothetical protein ACTSPS_13845, partial [Promethearchaeota archaeon]
MDFDIIKKTPIYEVLSERGKRIFLPDGIFYWSGRAKKEAELIGTIGTAFAFEKDFIDGGSDEWVPCYFKDISKYTPLHIKNVVPYASIGGLADLRATWKKWIIKKSLFEGESEKAKLEKLERYITLPIITSGVTNGIFLCCSLFLNKNEIIISPNKRWGNYD